MNFFSKSLRMLKSLDTKRQMISQASKNFNPLGWISPVTMKTKIILQDLWISGLDWEDEAPEKIIKNFNNHLS